MKSKMTAQVVLNLLNSVVTFLVLVAPGYNIEIVIDVKFSCKITFFLLFNTIL